MNFLIVENLKDALVVIRKRLAKIESKRTDYKESKTWVELKIKEQKICGKIKEINRRTKIELERNKKMEGI